MTDYEIVENLCRIQSRFQEILFELANNSSDLIPNLSDITLQYNEEAGKDWKVSTTYKAGIVVSRNSSDIYISLIDNNIGNTPENSPSYWKFLDVSTLMTGKYYMSAMCRMYLKTKYDISSVAIINSFNITSIEYQGLDSGIYKLNFDQNSGLYDNNYLVFSNGKCDTSADGAYNRPTFNQVNIIFKSANYLLFKIPNNLNQTAFSILILPEQ